MKKIIATIGLASTLLLSGCGGVDSGNNARPNNYFNKTATLQGTVFDGITGAKITDKSLKVTMVQGSNYRNASTRTGTQDFAGDYSISGIPISINNQTQYRMAVTADTYQAFESSIAFDADGAGSNSTYDTTYNYVGNVYLFPLGTNANDVTVRVEYNGAPVADATVQLTRWDLNVVGEVQGYGSDNIFSNIDSGYLGNLTAVTDADGIATFSGTTLVLGGKYDVEVLPVTHDGTPLAWSEGIVAPIYVGDPSPWYNSEGNITRIVSMDTQVPGYENGLYIVDASNSDSTTVDSTGILIIKFSKPVELSETNPIVVTVTLTNAGAAVLDPTTPVTAVMSTDGLTLTLTPKFTTAPQPGDFGATVEYNNTSVRLTGAGNAFAYDVFVGLVNTGGATISSRVQMMPWN